MPIITYCDDRAALVAEIEALAPEHVFIDENTGTKRITGITKTPSVKSGIESLAVCSGLPPAFKKLKHLSVLGTVEQLNGEWVPIIPDPANRQIYDRLWPRFPVKSTDEYGAEHVYTPPAVPGII